VIATLGSSSWMPYAPQGVKGTDDMMMMMMTMCSTLVNSGDGDDFE